jgi:hypothetical protein
MLANNNHIANLPERAEGDAGADEQIRVKSDSLRPKPSYEAYTCRGEQELSDADKRPQHLDRTHLVGRECKDTRVRNANTQRGLEPVLKHDECLQPTGCRSENDASR